MLAKSAYFNNLVMALPFENFENWTERMEGEQGRKVFFYLFFFSPKPDPT